MEDKRDVYLIDLSTIEGLKYADLIVQANDIIYVEPVPEIGRELVKDIAPIVSLLSSVWLIYITFQNLQ
jgi:polysaccharide export outer membrane protein